MIENITEQIRKRRSVRTYDGRALDAATKEQLLAFLREVENPFGIPMEFQLLDAKAHGLVCPVVSGTELYVAGKCQAGPVANAAFGYAFEAFVLYAQSLGIGTVWLGGTMNRPAYEAALALEADEIMPCASPLGYPAKKMSLKESMMRKAIRADSRLSFEELFFAGNFDMPLTKEQAGRFAEPLEMVRLAPSAVNKQPWCVVVADDTAHFNLKRSRSFSHEGRLDMQQIDVGIALCHFDLTAKALGMEPVFSRNDPGLVTDAETEYIASYQLQ